MNEIDKKRIQNEKKFSDWVDIPGGGRRYWFEVKGKFGWKARYVKEVNADEDITQFYQEISDETGVLIETHEKFPINKGHKRCKE